MSAKESADQKPWQWSDLKNINPFVAFLGAVTGTIALMWKGIEHFYEEKVSRILGETEAARRQDKAEAEAARLQGIAEAEAARLKGIAEAQTARLQDKVEFYTFYAKALGTRDYEPLKEALLQQQKEKEGRQATSTGERVGTK